MNETTLHAILSDSRIYTIEDEKSLEIIADIITLAFKDSLPGEYDLYKNQSLFASLLKVLNTTVKNAGDYNWRASHTFVKALTRALKEHNLEHYHTKVEALEDKYYSVTPLTVEQQEALYKEVMYDELFRAMMGQGYFTAQTLYNMLDELITDHKIQQRVLRNLTSQADRKGYSVDLEMERISDRSRDNITWSHLQQQTAPDAA